MRNQQTPIVRTEVLPAAWASALINGDFSGVDFDGYGLEIRAFITARPECAAPVGCSEESYPAIFNGLLTDCLDYFYIY
jgi:hypothetical protein